MLIEMVDESAALIGAGIAGQANVLKALCGEEDSEIARGRGAHAKLQVRASEDPDDLEGEVDDAKIAAAAEDGRLAGAEKYIKAGRGAPMRKSMSDLLRELRQLADPQVPVPLLKSFRPVAVGPRLGFVVTAPAQAGHGITLNR